ncbi:outer membrane immunogenic protein [Bradyrhizobium sp. GM2.2]|uniref:outer membrane protein n=1 Tax=unclassified Bradyrhizobium TaxID=2631580 RepID=UPI001FFC1200|nr:MULTISPECIES: outer membrane beta-barrel protein [unclassified Bradyrhizobium]MCK1296510.1 porin family protein [Bradyrhizobium sp. 30]MCK1306616.1 porin family protein [Bradyrhizobium sp. 45]MCK1332893.1 porin family protein [Bradyrhizobium sp. CW9]MCK1345107.1 porin family protein [Bradyrhizobium sp. CW11]MCK1353249.1 porin family protein [Bradyrhizobium sp. CW7]MCK1469206.1 porin family protein [Bradyrhizobium sp. CW10]MCK1481785.1 porin family protein [Bradyrhizobium sp. 193]MCK15001
MRKLLLTAAGALALGLSAPASAADMAARPYTKAPPMVAAIYDWSGFYIGANGGWGSSRNSWDSVAPFLVGPEGSHDATGGVAGGQVGYRWQTGTWVFGLEAQGDWADLRGNNLSTLFGPGFRNDSRINAFGLFTGQLGWATNNVLFYVKGGAAVTDNRNRIYSTATGAVLATTGDDTRWGGTVGVGLEYGFAPGWSAGVEYDHLFMQDRTLTFTGPAGLAFGADRIRQDVDLVTVRVNYKFGGPSIGRY